MPRRKSNTNTGCAQRKQNLLEKTLPKLAARGSRGEAQPHELLGRAAPGEGALGGLGGAGGLCWLQGGLSKLGGDGKWGSAFLHIKIK